MKSRTLQKLFGIALGIAGFVLTFVWYDWKLALILFIVLWSNNIDNNLKHNIHD